VCCVFVRCSKSELLVVLKQPEGLEGPTHISLFTDNANHLVLHWGTCKPGTAAHLGLGKHDGITFRHVALRALGFAYLMPCKTNGRPQPAVPCQCGVLAHTPRWSGSRQMFAGLLSCYAQCARLFATLCRLP
jgi:hypothetical protein